MQRVGIESSQRSLLRVLVLSGQGPTLMILFNLHSLLSKYSHTEG